MDAETKSVEAQVAVDTQPTFQELLACIFLEQCLVGNWSLKVVNHELEDGDNLLLRIASKLGECCVLQGR